MSCTDCTPSFKFCRHSSVVIKIPITSTGREFVAFIFSLSLSFSSFSLFPVHSAQALLTVHQVLLEILSSPDSAKICSSDLESQPQSVTFDDDYKDFPTPNSEDLAPPSSDNQCVLDSDEFGSASSIGSCKSQPEHKGRPEMTEQTEEQPQKTKKRLRMLDEDADGVRIKVIPDFRKQFRARMTAT